MEKSAIGADYSRVDCSIRSAAVPVAAAAAQHLCPDVYSHRGFVR
jgi:hypothetical protein